MATKKKTTDPSELRGLFEQYDAQDERIAKIKEKITAIKSGPRSDVAKQIFDIAGKGPFDYNGRKITIVNRLGVYMFREHGAQEGIEV